VASTLADAINSKIASSTRTDFPRSPNTLPAKDGTPSKSPTTALYSPSRLAHSPFPLPSITFERIPSDYAILKIIKKPEDAGGDTLWASGYELYDRLSPDFQKLAEGLTATHHQPGFVKVANEFGEALIEQDRGAPENTGLDFKASQ
jgi:alpha-ketoglutarate-dependent taurine dioxygenase